MPEDKVYPVLLDSAGLKLFKNENFVPPTNMFYSWTRNVTSDELIKILADAMGVPVIDIFVPNSQGGN
jgi:hypothetical protein